MLTITIFEPVNKVNLERITSRIFAFTIEPTCTGHRNAWPVGESRIFHRWSVLISDPRINHRFCRGIYPSRDVPDAALSDVSSHDIIRLPFPSCLHARIDGRRINSFFICIQQFKRTTYFCGPLFPGELFIAGINSPYLTYDARSKPVLLDTGFTNASASFLTYTLLIPSIVAQVSIGIVLSDFSYVDCMYLFRSSSWVLFLGIPGLNQLDELAKSPTRRMIYASYAKSTLGLVDRILAGFVIFFIHDK